jgi:hypothetical protein
MTYSRPSTTAVVTSPRPAGIGAARAQPGDSRGPGLVASSTATATMAMPTSASTPVSSSFSIEHLPCGDQCSRIQPDALCRIAPGIANAAWRASSRGSGADHGNR